MKTSTIFLFLLVWNLQGIKANNISISNISVTGQNAMDHYCLVQFDVSWDNSWRTSDIPGNWDAAWIFIKYRVFSGPWKHATLSASAADHTAPSGSIISPGTDGKGVLIYRSTNGNGTNVWNVVRLRWNYGNDNVGDDVTFELKVFAIEMVYIPQGSFTLGDGDGSTESLYAYHRRNSDSAVSITTELTGDIRVDFNPLDDTQLISSGIGIDGDGGCDWDDNGTIDNPLFPTGYKAFYIMKYELSQEQYRDFLNCLTRPQQQSRVATDISGQYITNTYVLPAQPYALWRNGIACNDTLPQSPSPVTFYCDLFTSPNTYDNPNDGQNIPCNILTWADGAAYADWSGLRPMTEMEYEKACRGPNPPIANEFAWGSTNICNVTSYALTYQGETTEGISNMCTNTGNAVCHTLANNGPFRCGIFAASAVNHTRQETGATYYGVMEMSGNLYEPIVAVGLPAGRSYTGLHGNGILTPAGDADVDYWPGINGNNDWGTPNSSYGGTTGVTKNAGLGSRGGATNIWISSLYISSRERSNPTADYQGRSYSSGMRFVHSLP